MIQVSQSTKNLVNAYNKEVFGETMEEVRAKAKAKAKADAKANKELEKELKKMDDKLRKTIALLYTKVGMTIEEIATHLEISSELITETLSANKAL